MPQGKFKKIVLHIPHSRFNINWETSGWSYNANLINDMIRNTDWHTDFIFHSDDPRIKKHVFKMSRYDVDVERLENDPLESEGRGIVYRNVGTIKRDKLNYFTERNLYRIRKGWLLGLGFNLDADTILLDCHSFNNEVAPDVDICIGFNEDWSKPDVGIIEEISNIFKAEGYKVAFNKPYGNSITPETISPETNCKYKSLMIEVNKKTYLRCGIEINVDGRYAPRLCRTIRKVYDYLLGETNNGST